MPDLFEVLLVLDQQLDDAVVQVFQTERLGNECIGILVGFEFDAVSVLSREDDDRQEGRGHRAADPAAHLQAVHHGHHDVGDDQVDLVSGQKFEPQLSVFGADERVVVAQRGGDEVADVAVVLDQEDDGFPFVVPHLREAVQRDIFVAVLVLHDEGVGLHGREPHGEAASFARRGVDADRSLVHLDDAFHQIEPDSGAVAVAVLIRRRAVVLVEDVRQLLGTDADAGILHGDVGIDQVAGLPADGDADQDAAARRGELHGVREQVAQHRLDLHAVEHEDVADVVAVEARVDSLFGHRRGEFVVDLAGELDDRRRRRNEQCAVVRFVVRDHLVDQQVHLFGIALHGDQLLAVEAVGLDRDEFPDVPQNDAQRRFEFVGEVRQEVRLHLDHLQGLVAFGLFEGELPAGPDGGEGGREQHDEEQCIDDPGDRSGVPLRAHLDLQRGRVFLNPAVGEDRPHLEEVGARGEVDEGGVVAAVLGDLPVVVESFQAVGVAVFGEREVEIGEFQRERVAVVRQHEPVGDVDVAGQQDVVSDPLADADPMVADVQTRDARPERFVALGEVLARNHVIAVGRPGIDLLTVDKTAQQRVVADPMVPDSPPRTDVVGRHDGVADGPYALLVGGDDPDGEPRSGDLADGVLMPDVEPGVGPEEDPVSETVESLRADPAGQPDGADLARFGVDRHRALIGGYEAERAVYGDLRGDVAREAGIRGAEMQVGGVARGRVFEQPALVDDEHAALVGADPEPSAVVFADAVHPRGVVAAGRFRDREAAEAPRGVFIEVQSAVRGDPYADLVGMQTADLVVGDPSVGASAVGFEPGRRIPPDADQPVLPAEPERPFAVLAHGADGESLVAPGDGFQMHEGVETALHGHADAVVGGHPDVAPRVFVDPGDDVVGDRGGVARFVDDVLLPAVGPEEVDALVGPGPEVAAFRAHEAAHGDVVELHAGLSGRGVEPYEPVLGSQEQRPGDFCRGDDVVDEVAVPAVEQRNGNFADAAPLLPLVDFVVRAEIDVSVDLAAAHDVPVPDDLLAFGPGESLLVTGQEHQTRGGSHPEGVVVFEQGPDVARAAGVDAVEPVDGGVVEAQPAVGADQNAVVFRGAEQGVDRVVAERRGVVFVVEVGDCAVRVVSGQAVRRSGPDVSAAIRYDGECRFETAPESLEIRTYGLGCSAVRAGCQKQKQRCGDRLEDDLSSHVFETLYRFTTNIEQICHFPAGCLIRNKCCPIRANKKIGK